MSRNWVAIVLASMFPLLNGASCTTSDRGRDEPYYGDGDREPYEDRYGLPDNAEMVRETRGQRVEFVPNRSGDYFLYYARERRIITGGRLLDGERLVVDPDRNRVYVEGRTVFDGDLKSDRTYRVYFARSDGRPYDVRRDWEGSHGERPPTGIGATVPRGAEAVGSGRGKVEFAPTKSSGDWYVADERYGVVVASGQIVKGQRLLVDPARGQVMLDKRVVVEKGIRPDSTHKIYFVKR